VTVQSSGLSLLAPQVTVLAADQSTPLGSANGLGQYGTTLTVTLNNQVSAGQQIYIKVTGADTTAAFNTGAYALTLNFGTGSSPTVPLPNTQTANGDPLSSGGGIPDSTKDDPNSGVDVFPPISDATASTGNAETTTATPNYELVLFLAGGQRQAPEVYTAVVLPGTPAATLGATPAPQAPLAVPVLNLLYGGAGNRMATAEDDLLPLATPSSNETTTPAPAAQEQTESTREAVSSTAFQQQACDACFKDTSWMAASTQAGETSLEIGTESFDGANPAIAAGLLVALGGYWGAQREPSDRSTRRLFSKN
jgi:hypothetical protein